MLDIYYCYDCARYFTEEELDDKRVCLEEEYGVSGDFKSKTYANVSCCPHCKSTDYQIENDTDEIVEILNAYAQYNVGKVKEKIKQLEKYKLAVELINEYLDISDRISFDTYIVGLAKENRELLQEILKYE